MSWHTIWPELVRLFLTTIVTGGVVSAIFERWTARQLETHKANLARDSAIQLERLRADLVIATNERGARFAAVNARRIEAIEKTYVLLSDLETELESIMKPFSVSGERTRTEKAPKALDALNAFLAAYHSRKLYFDAESVVHLDTISDIVRVAWTRFTTFGVEAERDDLSAERYRQQQIAWKKIKEELPLARLALESTFRAELGIVPAPSPVRTPAPRTTITIALPSYTALPPAGLRSLRLLDEPDPDGRE